MKANQIMEEDYQPSGPTTLTKPGKSVKLPTNIEQQLKSFFPAYRKRQQFFGGHPVSMVTNTLNQIFSTRKQNGMSPYLVCEKTDGVRYLMLVVKNRDTNQVQTYLLSRAAQKGVDSYLCDLGISNELDIPLSQQKKSNSAIIEVLDGELVFEADVEPLEKGYRFLIFDALLHLGRSIIEEPLKIRLDCAFDFLKANSIFQSTTGKIEILVKDFFRITNYKFNVTEFMLKKYIQLLRHENDGLIFNHQDKKYVLGTTNDGYIKWKPSHLNTVDFMVSPNTNFDDTKYRGRILDLYCAIQDTQAERYKRVFYSFAIVSSDHFEQIQRQIQKLRQESMKNSYEQSQLNDFKGAIIAQCKYEGTVPLSQQRKFLNQLTNQDTKMLQQALMRPDDENRDRDSITKFKNRIYDKGWKIYKIRQDKSLPNNIQVLKKIEDSIRDGITEEVLLNKAKAFDREVFR